MRSRLLSAAVVAVIAAIALAAPAAGVTRGPTPAGRALASSALLRRSDFGRGWSVSAPPPRSTPGPSCPRFHPVTSGVVEIGAASSPTFSGGSGGPFVSQQAFAYATSAQRASIWGKVARPGLLRCVKYALVHSSSGGVHFTVTGGRRLPLPALGVMAHGYRVSGTANTTNQSVNVYVDLILLARGRTVTAFNVSSFQAPVSRKLELRLARVIAARLSAT